MQEFKKNKNTKFMLNNIFVKSIITFTSDLKFILLTKSLRYFEVDFDPKAEHYYI